MIPADLLDALRSPSAYPVDTTDVEFVETHISRVFLLDRDVFKLKKPVDLGFLDYSSLERRRHFCEEEVRLNRRLAPDVYLGVEPIVATPDGYRVGGEGDPVEYAVHMVRLPDAARLSDRIEAGTIPPGFWARLGERLARFYREAERSDEISRDGAFAVVARNARDNGTATEPFIGHLLTAVLHRRVAAATEAALARFRPLIEGRAARGVPCDTHGDLRLDHVYLFPERERPHDLMIIDGIEFSPLLRHADPVSDVAFLVMDLEFSHDLESAAALIDAYVAASGDEEGRALFPFYTAYRNAVRAKVDHFTLAGAEIPRARRAHLEERALGHWLGVLGELESPTRRPALLLVGGPPGCGKSTLARSLADQGGFEWVRSDAVRRELHSGLSAEERYTPERTAEVYEACLARVDAVLRDGGRALVDATFHAEAPRRAALDLARRRRVPIVHIDLSIDRESAHARIRSRGEGPSEADPAVHDAMVAEWEPPTEETAPMRRSVPAAGSPEETLARARRVLSDARLL